MTQPALAAFDPDIRDSHRKPQFANQFDPRWAVNFYFGCGSGPYALVPYTSRGVVAKMAPISSGKLDIYADGWSVNTQAGGTAGYGVSNGATATTWWPSATGTLIVTFRATFSANDGNNHLVFVYGNSATGPVLELNKFTDNKLYAGWVNGSDGRVATAASGVWVSGDLVTLAVDWDNSGAASYAQGAQQGTQSSTNLPVNFSGTSNNGLMVGNGTTGESAATDRILCATLLDRRLSAAEHAWIAANPLAWPFLPGPVTAALAQLVAPPPPPTLPPRSNYEVLDLRARGYESPVNLTIIGRDQFFGAPGQVPPNTDWPVPKGPRQPLDLLTWSQARFQGIDTFYGLGGPSYDYPNPRAPLRAVDLLSWIQSANPAIVPIPGTPFTTRLDWPNPRGPEFPIGLRSWAASQNLASDSFYGLGGPAYDWPNPRGPAHLTHLRSWTQSRNLGVDPLLGAIERNYDFPNPRGRASAVTLSWIQPSAVTVIGIDATRMFLVMR